MGIRYGFNYHTDENISNLVPMLDYHIPRFEFFKNIKINYCPMCGRKLSND